MSDNQWADEARKLSEDEILQALEHVLEMGAVILTVELSDKNLVVKENL